jgi:hypothetical protein
MGGNENDGYYCTICGGIPPNRITTKRVLINGRKTGIDHIDWIFEKVRKLATNNNDAVTEEILKQVKQFNYVPTKKTAEYGAGLLAAYKKFRAENPYFFIPARTRHIKNSLRKTSIFSDIRRHVFHRPLPTHRITADEPRPESIWVPAG